VLDKRAVITLLRRIIKRVSGGLKQAGLFLPQFFALRSGGRAGVRFALQLRDIKACLVDATSTTGFDRHYVFHCAWAARVLARNRPVEHTDISSSLFFIGGVSAFVPIRFLDFRPANLGLSMLREEAVDIRQMPFKSESIHSLSCMHVVEHIGLGRYGDPIDYDGDLTACAELKRVIAPGGWLLFVVPLAAQPRIAFNAHRVYAFDQVLGMFDGLDIEEFCLVPDREVDGGLVVSPSKDLLDRQRYGCGCFLFRKPESIKVEGIDR
jgi:hypothetical protein